MAEQEVVTHLSPQALQLLLQGVALLAGLALFQELEFKFLLHLVELEEGEFGFFFRVGKLLSELAELLLL